MNSDIKTPEMIFDTLLERYPALNECSSQITAAYETIRNAYENGGTLYTAGNGGSAADSDHIVGELMKSFMFKRPVSDELKNSMTKLFGEDGEALAKNLEGGLGAVSLPSLTALSTAVSNDTDPKTVFAQMINSLGKKGDVFLGISTSGNSANIIYAMMTAKAKGLAVIGMTGSKACKMDGLCDAVIHVPESETYKVQELHLPVYHALCAMLESAFFGINKN